jgi:16S rRNA (adenine1518-N6/adenine1519-N6)-dimethyltransferase
MTPAPDACASRLANPRATRGLLEEFGLTAKYALGQNFLVNDGVVAHILELAKLEPTDVVLEVGPGIGTLTSALLPRAAAVVAVEADDDMRGPLSVTTADYSERFALVMGDALRVEPAQLGQALAGLAAHGLALPQGAALPSRWVSNLPYAVAATLILKVFQEWDFVRDATVMVQSEVADRIAAQPGTKAYGAYTVKLRLHARVAGRFQVPPSSFFPAPHVESAVVRLERLDPAQRLDPALAQATATVVDAAFAQRRKTIRNSMGAAGLWSKVELDAAYEACGIEPTCRAETLEPHDFVRLARALGAPADVRP